MVPGTAAAIDDATLGAFMTKALEFLEASGRTTAGNAEVRAYEGKDALGIIERNGWEKVLEALHGDEPYLLVAVIPWRWPTNPAHRHPKGEPNA